MLAVLGTAPPWALQGGPVTAPVWDERRAGEWVLHLAARLYGEGDRERASRLCDAATVLPGGSTRDRIERELHALGWPGETVARAIEDLEAAAMVAAPCDG